MFKHTAPKREWIKPELQHLGKIRDVAGKEVPISQAVNTKS